MVASMGWNCVLGGRRRSEESNGEFVGMNAGVWGSPMWVSDVVLQISSRETQWDLWFWRSPPISIEWCGYSSLRSLVSRWSMAWYSIFSCAVVWLW